MARYCLDCGETAKEGDQFCYYCGEELPSGTDGPSDAVDRHCPSCGAGVDGDDGYCYHCGTRLWR